MTMSTDQKLYEKADALEAQAKSLREQAAKLRQDQLRATPIFDRMIYAATSRCECGAGLAYDPASEGSGPFKGPSEWECGDILRYATLTPDEQVKVKAATHTAPLPFAFYEIKSEKQPSQNGATTRPERN
jgi:hypothetical protein